MKRNHKTGKRIISLLVTLAMCMSIVPAVLADAPTSEGWTVRAFGADDFHVYKHAAVDSADASRITGKTIDLSDPLHFYYGISGISYDGFAMMRVESANDKTVPVAGATIADKGFYQLSGMPRSGSFYEYFTSQEAETVKNYSDDGKSYTEATYADGTTMFDKGMSLQYLAGSKDEYYIKPGYYRFVHFHREARTITYSDVYQITDKNGIYTGPGSADVSVRANGIDTSVNSILSDDTFDLTITSLKAADGSEVNLDSANITNIEFLTNYTSISINGSSTDSVVSYALNYGCTMYNGSAVSDGRTLEKSNGSVTLKNCTAKYIMGGKYLYPLVYDGEMRKYRIRVTATVNGAEKVFMTDAPLILTAAYSVTTIITDSLNKGSIGVAYNTQLSGATPDKSELKWTVDSGELPPGLTLGQNGTISGTPTTAGTYKFKVKMTATGDGTSDTKEYTVVITKRQLAGYWWMNLTSESYYKGDITNYTVIAKPVISGGTPFEGTPVSGTTLNVSFDYGVQNDSTVTVTKPASGVTATVNPSYNEVTLTFDGSAEITADGIEFTINNVKNPDSSYIYSSVSSSSNDRSSRLNTNTTDMDITNGYTYIPLTSADGINLTIVDYESYKDMSMRLVITHNNEDTISYISGSVTGIDNLGIQKGDEYTVRLEAKDALWNGHTYYQSGTLTGDGNGNPLTITPNPAASETLTGYTLTSTLAGVANRDIPTDIYKDGKQLGTNGGYYWLTNADGITAKPSWSFSSSYPDYDSEGAVTVNGTQITVDYPKLAQTAQLTGTVKNTSSEPVANAAVVANVNINGTTVTYNTVTAKDGSYVLNNMYNGKNVTITAWADGYEEGSKTVTLNNTATSDITLSPTSSITVTVGDGQSVTKPEFTVYDSSDNTVTSHRFTSGSRFTLALPSSASNAEGTAYKVNMTSEDTSGTATGTAAFGADKSASVSLTPERLGYIDWSKVDGTDFRVLVYEDGSFYKSFEATEQQCVVPAGEYTVYLSKNYSKQDEDPSETVTVEAGKTVSLSIKPPKSEKFVVASANGPKTAEKGKYYEVSGVIESATDAQGRQFFGLDAYTSSGVTVIGYKINGSYVGLAGVDGREGWSMVNKYYAPSEYPYVDWSFPLSYTLYVRQNADFGDNQSVTMYACYGDSSSSYSTNVTTIGTVITKSAPGITITCPEVLGSKTVKTDIGDTEKDTLVPNDLDFSGTAPSNAYVKIYDNDTLIAIAKADAKGNYSGRASLSSSYRSHTLRAEADTNLGGEDTVISAEKSFTYSPTGPVLTGLWLNGSKLSITGGMTAYYPNRNYNNAGYTYEASFENDDRLADITVDDMSELPTEGGERAQITGKVFFIVSTSTGSYTLKAEKKQSGLWTATSALGGSDPLDVKVMYEEKDDLTAPKVTITDVTNNNEQVEITPDNAYAVKLKDGETVDWSDKAGLLEALGISEGEAVTDDTADLDPDYTWVKDDTDYELSSFEADNAEAVSGLDGYFELMSSAKSTSDLMNSLAAQLQSSGVVDDPNDESLINEDGIKAVDALTTSQAYAKSGNYYEERTWIDSPTWTESGVKWHIEELTANGYKPNYLTDSSSGREYIYFEQTLYYGQYGDPVAELYKRASDNGIPKNVVSPLMFENGKAKGSTLRVKYVYDVTAGKWMRMQTAIMPPNTTSPIHTSPNQIPNKSERPYRYVPVSDLNLTSTGDFSLMASGQRTGGMSVKIRLDRVSEKTYGSAVCSVGSFATAKFLQTQKVHKFVDVNNAKWGEYALSFEESAGGLFWTGVGSNVPDEGQSSIVPTERDAGVGSLDALRKSLESNYRYYARLDKEGGVHRATAQYGKEQTKKLLGELADLEYAIEMAGVQDAFTKSVSDQLSGASAFVGMFGGTVGAGGAVVMDTINVLINAANDTNNAEVMEAAEKFKSKVDRYMSNDKADKERMKKDEQEKKDYNNSTGFQIYGVEDEVFDDPFDGGSSKPTAPTAQTVPVHDPSGVVYEGVIENPVEGATVTLYKYDAESGVPVQHDDSLYLQQQNPLTTDENGHYNWDVPEGEWYVTASKDGYTPGNSGADTAAKVTHTVGGETMNFLPVLPPQLDVNIPLVDKTVPEVTDVTYTPEGIYVTFSKYMVDTGYNDNGSVLESNNYTLTGADGPITSFYAESVVQGHVPSNIDINKRTYTKTVRLVPTSGTEFEGDISLTVSGSVKSYAGTAIDDIYTDSGTAEAGEIELSTTQTASGAVIKNNSFFSGKATIIVSDYDKDGALVNVSSEEYEFSALDEKTVNFTNTLTHKVFVWDSLSGMKPLDVKE